MFFAGWYTKRPATTTVAMIHVRVVTPASQRPWGDANRLAEQIPMQYVSLAHKKCIFGSVEHIRWVCLGMRWHPLWAVRTWIYAPIPPLLETGNFCTIGSRVCRSIGLISFFDKGPLSAPLKAESSACVDRLVTTADREEPPFLLACSLCGQCSAGGSFSM